MKVICEICKKEFNRNPCSCKKHIFCSPECYNKWVDSIRIYKNADERRRVSEKKRRLRKQNNKINKLYNENYNKIVEYVNENHQNILDIFEMNRIEYNKNNAKKWRDNNKDRIKEWRENNKDRIKEWRENNKDRIKEWNNNNKDRNKELNKKWRENNKDKAMEGRKRWKENNKDKIKEYVKKIKQNERYELIYWYSNGLMRCSKCGESHIEFLEIDHIHNDGNKHRKINNIGPNIVWWILKNNFPEDFQILCTNCNLKKWKNILKSKRVTKKQISSSRSKEKIKQLIFAHYGGDHPMCECCNEDDIDLLTIDHINCDGAEHKRQLGNPGYFYRDIIKNNYPTTYRILCHNCNAALGRFGYCPHNT